VALLSVILAVASASQPLAIWSSSDTQLGQQVRTAVEKAVAASSSVHSVQSPQGDAPSLFVDDMRLVGNEVSFRIRIFVGEPLRSEELWSSIKTCPRDNLDRCAAEIVERLPDLSQR